MHPYDENGTTLSAENYARINLQTILANAQLGAYSDRNSRTTENYLMCPAPTADHGQVFRLLSEMSIPNNSEGENVDGYSLSADKKSLFINGDSAIAALITKGYKFPGINEIAQKIGVKIPAAAPEPETGGPAQAEAQSAALAQHAHFPQ